MTWKQRLVRELREDAFLLFLGVFLLYSLVLFIVLLLGAVLVYTVTFCVERDVRDLKKIWPKTNQIMNRIIEMWD